MKDENESTDIRKDIVMNLEWVAQAECKSKGDSSLERQATKWEKRKDSLFWENGEYIQLWFFLWDSPLKRAEMEMQD